VRKSIFLIQSILHLPPLNFVGFWQNLMPPVLGSWNFFSFFSKFFFTLEFPLFRIFFFGPSTQKKNHPNLPH